MDSGKRKWFNFAWNYSILKVAVAFPQHFYGWLHQMLTSTICDNHPNCTTVGFVLRETNIIGLSYNITYLYSTFDSMYLFIICFILTRHWCRTLAEYRFWVLLQHFVSIQIRRMTLHVTGGILYSSATHLPLEMCLMNYFWPRVIGRVAVSVFI